MKTSVIFAVVCGCAALLMTSTARADDVTIDAVFSNMSPQQFQHDDLSPFKGTVTVNLTNSGSEPWGDFHFEFYGVGISNVSFLDASMPPDGQDPTSTQTPFSWTIDNDVVGATMDLYFYSDPVLSTETATFTVYTANPDHLSFFGLMMYPTPVPEPASIMLLGLAALLIRRR
jgi:hypothetical protein